MASLEYARLLTFDRYSRRPPLGTTTNERHGTARAAASHTSMLPAQRDALPASQPGSLAPTAEPGAADDEEEEDDD